MSRKKIPELDVKFYTSAYHDVRGDPIFHYTTIGKREIPPRLPSANAFYAKYPDFDAGAYYNNYSDLRKMTPEQRMVHWYTKGVKENRHYKTTKPKTIFNHMDLPIKNETESKTDNYFNMTNIDKIILPEQSKEHSIHQFAMDDSLNEIISARYQHDRPVYLILGEWGYPPYGGGEAWMVDTAKWMNRNGFECYYIYFMEHSVDIQFHKYHVFKSVHDESKNNLTFIQFPKSDKLQLLQFISLLKPVIISHQGLHRSEYLKIANILNIPFITGFCYWQDIIEIPKPNLDVNNPINRNMLSKNLIPDSNFDFILNHSAYIYVCGQFVNDIIEKVHHKSLPIINTITDRDHFNNIPSESKGTKEEGIKKYVTIINIARLKGGNMLDQIIRKCNDNVVFCVIDSQVTEFTDKVKRAINDRNDESIFIEKQIPNLTDIYRNTKILLIPSLVDETFCRVAYEGMSLGIPIISTKCGNLKHLLHNYAHFIAPDDIENPQKWADIINKLYNNEAKLLEMSCRPKHPTINQNIEFEFVSIVKNVISHYVPYSNDNNNTHSELKNIGILCPWADQGLGIQCREYYDLLTSLSMEVSVFAFKPYHAGNMNSNINNNSNNMNDNSKLQTDPNEWNRPRIWYSDSKRKDINHTEFFDYLHTYKIHKFIIAEPGSIKENVYHLAKICKMLGIQTYCIPNMEIIQYSELPSYEVFDKILVNNYKTLEFMRKWCGVYSHKVFLLQFGILNKYFNINVNVNINNDGEKNTIKLFCLGGLNSITRKNILLIYEAFKSIKPKDINDRNIILNIYIQGVENHASLKNTDNIKIHNKSLSYKKIAELYQHHNIVIHMGGHEGLGLGYYEALASGIPLIGMNCPPCNEIITDFSTNGNGWLVPCSFAPLTDNDEGLVNNGIINVSDLKTTIITAINEYDNKVGKMKLWNPRQYINNVIKHIIF